MLFRTKDRLLQSLYLILVLQEELLVQREQSNILLGSSRVQKPFIEENRVHAQDITLAQCIQDVGVAKLIIDLQLNMSLNHKHY